MNPIMEVIFLATIGQLISPMRSHSPRTIGQVSQNFIIVIVDTSMGNYFNIRQLVRLPFK
jgi:hypothetical protein